MDNHHENETPSPLPSSEGNGHALPPADEPAAVDDAEMEERWKRFARELEEIKRMPRAQDPTPSFPPSFDATGRLLPLTDEQIRERAEFAIRGLDALDEMGDEEEQRQTLEALIKGLNEDFPDRKRFR